MMTKLRASAVFVPPSCTPLSETLELSNKQDRRGGSPSLEFSSLQVILHAGLVWLLRMWKQVRWQDSGRTLAGFACTAAHLLMTGLWEAGPLCTLL